MKILFIIATIMVSLVSFNSHAVYAKITACDEAVCKDYFKTYKKYARMGYADAMDTLGQLYYYGYGTKKNVKKALKQYRSAAKYGSVKGQYNAAMIYINEDKFRDIDEGVKYLKKAARNKNVSSAFLLGMIYFSPDFYEQDFDEADKWLTMAYESGSKEVPPYLRALQSNEQFTQKNFPELFNAIAITPLPEPEVTVQVAATTEANSPAATEIAAETPSSTNATAKERKITKAPENENLGDTEVITVVGRLTDLFDTQIASLRNAYPEKGGQSTGTKIAGKSCAQTLSCGYTNRQAFAKGIRNIMGDAAVAKFNSESFAGPAGF